MPNSSTSILWNVREERNAFIFVFNVCVCSHENYLISADFFTTTVCSAGNLCLENNWLSVIWSCVCMCACMCVCVCVCVCVYEKDVAGNLHSDMNNARGWISCSLNVADVWIWLFSPDLKWLSVTFLSFLSTHKCPQRQNLITQWQGRVLII